MKVEEVNHPVAQEALTVLRDQRTQKEAFRAACDRMGLALFLHACRDLPVKRATVTTPLADCEGTHLTPTALIPVLRAGLGMLSAGLTILPDAYVGYLGYERDEETAEARSYYSKLPELKGCRVFLLDPMLATGGTMASCVQEVRAHEPESVVVVSVVSAPEGIERLKALGDQAPDYVVTGAVDSHLNEKKYIVPGLGDMGDRLYGTGAAG